MTATTLTKRRLLLGDTSLVRFALLGVLTSSGFDSLARGHLKDTTGVKKHSPFLAFFAEGFAGDIGNVRRAGRIYVVHRLALLTPQLG